MNRCVFRLVVVLGLLGSLGIQAADVTLFEVRKGVQCTQTNSSTPVIPMDNGYVFSADVFPSGTNWVTGASVESPNTYAYLPLGWTGSRYQWQRADGVLGALDLEYANGLYQVIINGVHDGSRYFQMPLEGSAYPNRPHITDFGLVQRANANGYTMVTWDAFGSGTATDLVRLTVQDGAGNQVYQTQNSDDQRALNGGINWAVIGPGRLATNTRYSGKLLFQKNVWLDRAVYPGALGVAGYYTETQFPLQTTAARAPDVKTIELAKSLQFIQTNAAAPFLDPSPYQFSINLRAYATQVLSRATIVMPTNSAFARTNFAVATNELNLRFSQTARNKEGFDQAFGTGTYTLTFDTPNDGAKVLALTLDSVTNAPQAPQVVNLPGLQTVRALQELTVSWQRWTNGTVADFIQLRVEDASGQRVFETPDVGSANALHGLTTNAVLPAATLRTGQTYNAKLVFRRKNTLNTVIYPDVLTFTDYHSQTTFTLRTLPADVKSYDLIKEQFFTADVTGEPVRLSTGGFYVAAVLAALRADSVSAAAVTTPVGTSKYLVRQDAVWTFTNTSSTLTALNTAFPPGLYSFRVNGGGDGVRPLYATVPSSFPPAPRLLSYPRLANPDALVGVAWYPDFLNTNNTAQLKVRDANGTLVFATPAPGESNAVPVTAGACYIPAGRLLPNRFYSAELSFIAVQTTNTAAYDQRPGRVLMASTTLFKLGTQGPGNPPVLTVVSNSAEGMQFTAQVVSNQSYRIDYATNIPFLWVPLLTNTASADYLQFADPAASRRPQTFYRIVTW